MSSKRELEAQRDQALTRAEKLTELLQTASKTIDVRNTTIKEKDRIILTQKNQIIEIRKKNIRLGTVDINVTDVLPDVDANGMPKEIRQR